MPTPFFYELPVWQKLIRQAEIMAQPENHLKYLLEEKERLEKFSITGGGMFLDFSRQRITETVLELLAELAEARDVRKQFAAMTSGEAVNNTEKRAALHTACRNFSDAPVMVNGKDVIPELRAVRDKVSAFCDKIHAGEIKGSTGKPFRHIVVIGIGGSYLGAQFISEALAAYGDKGIKIHYLANVDIHNFGQVADEIEPETTLWVIISKSYTTAETLANTVQAHEFMKAKGLDPAKHVVTVTSKGSPGDDPANPVLDSFHMFDFIGGRYSVTSAVGGVPLGLYLGSERFTEFLKGAEEMDIHARTAPVRENLPLMAALISVWNNNFLGYGAQAIIPYAEPLCKLAPHVQQLYMESNGKSVTRDGRLLDGKQTGVIIFGEPGTNAQHSFFQLAHQGRPFPVDFIGVIHPQYPHYQAKSKGVTNHQELWANLISQPMALALGKDDPDPARSFSGNRPSSTILLKDLSARSVGRLLAFYEHRTVFEAFIWNINPFDQFGVELGKVMASGIRKQMAAKNENPAHKISGMDAVSEFYVNQLFSK